MLSLVVAVAVVIISVAIVRVVCFIEYLTDKHDKALRKKREAFYLNEFQEQRKEEGRRIARARSYRSPRRPPDAPSLFPAEFGGTIHPYADGGKFPPLNVTPGDTNCFLTSGGSTGELSWASNTFESQFADVPKPRACKFCGAPFDRTKRWCTECAAPNEAYNA